MTKEEKLQEAQRLYKTANADQRYVLESLFPELAESEDERIRKALIRYHLSTINIDGIKGEKILAWLEKQAPSTIIIIPKDLKGTDTDGGVVGERGEQGNNPEAELISAQTDSLKRRIEDNQLGCIVQRLDKIIELLQSAILPIPRSTYVPPIIYKNPLDPDPNTLGGWTTTANAFGSDYDIDTDKIKQDETNKSKS